MKPSILRSVQLLDRLRSGHGSPSSLAHLYWQLSRAERLRCQILCAKINIPWQKPSPPSLESSDLEQALFLNLCSEDYGMIWSIANKVNDSLRAGVNPSTGAFRPSEVESKPAFVANRKLIGPNIYLLLMSSIVQARSKSQVPLALQLFREFNTLSPSAADLQLACKLLFSAAEFCDSFPLLLDLRLVYENYVRSRSDIPETIEIQYCGATIHILLNSGQYSSAVRFLEETLTSLAAVPSALVFSNLPMTKLWNHACRSRDCPTLSDSLEAYLMKCDASTIKADEWMQYLSLGLAYNHYKLVKICYQGLQNSNVSLSPAVLAQVVHVFSTQGDVDMCTHVIEEHYLRLKGESALTKDLCLSIISAYCHRSDESQTDEDSSWYSVLDVIGAFSTRWQFSYHEITDAVSYKLNRLSITDDKVQWASRKDTYRVNKQLEDREAELEARDVDETPVAKTLPLPKKATNPNLRPGEQGNILRNMATLSRFTATTFEYMQQKQVGSNVEQLVVNCILSHINRYQNFSAAARFLEVLHEVDSEAAKSRLDADSYEVLFESISRSPATVKCGFFLFGVLKEKQVSLSHHQLECLVLSSLRSAPYNPLLEFYCHELLSQGHSPSAYLIRRISRHKQVNEEAKRLVTVLQDCQPGNKQWISDKWFQHNFQSTLDELQFPDLHGTYAEFDSRDCKILENVFGT